jgi:hypothetical protein
MRLCSSLKFLATLSMLVGVGCDAGPGDGGPVRHAVVSDSSSGTLADMKGSAGSGGSGGGIPACVAPIDYHGGPVIQGTFNVYYIWYGNWSSNTAIDILTELASNIGGSPYYNINSTYKDSTGKAVANSVKYQSSIVDQYSHGATITDADVQSIVASAIAGKKLPNDANGAYFVLASQDVKESSGYCVDYCGFHNNATVAGVDVKYSFVGNPAQCPNVCMTMNTAVSPNGNVGADGMASVIAHELNGMATDPDKNAWYFDSDHFENADQCAWQFGSTVTQPNGSQANVTLGTRNFLLQENWVNNACGECAISYP